MNNRSSVSSSRRHKGIASDSRASSDKAVAAPLDVLQRLTGLVLQQNGINDGDWQELKVCAIEREQVGDAVALHGGGKPGIVGT